MDDRDKIPLLAIIKELRDTGMFGELLKNFRLELMYDSLRAAYGKCFANAAIINTKTLDNYATNKLNSMHLSNNNDSVYRLHVLEDNTVELICFGIEKVDAAEEGTYASPNDLPDWVQKKLAVLMMMPCTPPTSEVLGVGRRIAEDIYWLYKE